MQVMDRMEPTVLLTLLPVIPVGLIFLKMVHWEDSLLLFLRKASRNVPVLNHILPSPVSVVFEFDSWSKFFAGENRDFTIGRMRGKIPIHISSYFS